MCKKIKSEHWSRYDRRAQWQIIFREDDQFKGFARMHDDHHQLGNHFVTYFSSKISHALVLKPSQAQNKVYPKGCNPFRFQVRWRPRLYLFPLYTLRVKSNKATKANNNLKGFVDVSNCCWLCRARTKQKHNRNQTVNTLVLQVAEVAEVAALPTTRNHREKETESERQRESGSKQSRRQHWWLASCSSVATPVAAPLPLPSRPVPFRSVPSASLWLFAVKFCGAFRLE